MWWYCYILYIPLPILLEESSDNKDLECAQGDDENTFNNWEPDDPRFCWADGREVSILPCTEVLLCSSWCQFRLDARELPMVDNCPESLKKDSSSLLGVSSSDEAAFCGNCARGSCSTYGWVRSIVNRVTVISKSTIFSANVDISFEKQKEYSPVCWAVNTKSPCLSLLPSMMTFWCGSLTS